MKVTSIALPRYWLRSTRCPSESRRTVAGAGFGGVALIPANLVVAALEAPPPPQPAVETATRRATAMGGAARNEMSEV